MPTAADVVNALDQPALASILRTYGEEKHARKIASAIVQARSIYPITRTQQLASIVAGSLISSRQCLREKIIFTCVHVFVCVHSCTCVCALIPQTPRGVHLYLKSCRIESCLSFFNISFLLLVQASPLQNLSPKYNF